MMQMLRMYILLWHHVYSICLLLELYPPELFSLILLVILVHMMGYPSSGGVYRSSVSLLIVVLNSFFRDIMHPFMLCHLMFLALSRRF
jgi:hypothetical protein